MNFFNVNGHTTCLNCNRDPLPSYSYCEDCKCVEENCAGIKRKVFAPDNVHSVKSDYCKNHKCSHTVHDSFLHTCMKRKIDGRHYCLEHTCSHKVTMTDKELECESQVAILPINHKMVHAEACKFHKCVIDKCLHIKSINSNYCQEHKCVSSSCKNKKMIKNNCVKHMFTSK